MKSAIKKLRNAVSSAHEQLCQAIDREFPVGSTITVVLRHGQPPIKCEVVGPAATSRYYLGQLRVQNIRTKAFRWANPLSDYYKVTLISKP